MNPSDGGFIETDDGHSSAKPTSGTQSRSKSRKSLLLALLCTLLSNSMFTASMNQLFGYFMETSREKVVRMAWEKLVLPVAVASVPFAISMAILGSNYIGYFSIIVFSAVILLLACLLPVLSLLIKPLQVYSGWMSAASIILSHVSSGMFVTAILCFGVQQLELYQKGKFSPDLFACSYLVVLIGRLTDEGIHYWMDMRFHEEKELGKLGPLFFALLLSILVLVSFLVGSKWYEFKAGKQHHTCIKFLRCICKAIINKVLCRGQRQGPHWLDYARGSGFKLEFITNGRNVLILFYMCLPIACYFFVQAQNVDALKAMTLRMNTQITEDWFLNPGDSLEIYGIILRILFLLIITWLVYPKLGANAVDVTFGQRMMYAMLLVSFGHSLTSILEYQVSKTDPYFPGREHHGLKVINALDKDIMMFLTGSPRFIAAHLGAKGGTSSFDNLLPNTTYKVRIGSVLSPPVILHKGSSGKVKSALVFKGLSGREWIEATLPEMNLLPKAGPSIRLVHHLPNITHSFDLMDHSNRKLHSFGTLSGTGFTNYTQVNHANRLHLECDGENLSESHIFNERGAYSILLLEKDLNSAERWKLRISPTSQPSQVHVLWILLPLTLYCLAAAFFTPSYLQLFYEKAPEGMKTTMIGTALFVENLGEVLSYLEEALAFGETKWLLYAFEAVAMALLTVYFGYLLENLSQKETPSPTGSIDETSVETDC